MAEGVSTKGEQTRELILSTALRLFREQGYDKTTMRMIAAEAGVAVGNAYYYFGSKEHLMQAYFDQLQEQHQELARSVLAGEKTFAARLSGVLRAWVEVFAPYHEHAGSFFKARPARETSLETFRQVVAGSDLKVPTELRAELPELLFLLQLGVVLFWVHDDSEGRVRTTALIDRGVPLADRLLRLTRMPGVRGAVNDLVGLVRSIRARE